MDWPFLIVAVIVFFAFFTQAATGFGAGVISLTLSALLFPIDVLLTWIVPLIALICSYLLIRHHDHIDWKLLLRVILPCMGGGMLVGQYFFYSLDGDLLKPILGVVVIGLALRELLRNADKQSRTPLLPWALAGGVIHGMFASGGPLLVYGLNAQPLDKAAFRSTLVVVWLVLALVLIASYIVSGKLTTAALPNIGILAAILPFSIIAGEKAHNHVPEATFKKAINVILIFCGVALLVR